MWSRVWPQLVGYMLVRIVTEPERIALYLQEPPGKTPTRILLLAPRSLEMSCDLPVSGIEVAKVEMSQDDRDEETIDMEFGDASTLHATCEHIRVLVY